MRVSMSLEDPESISLAIREVESRLGPIEILVNNAATSQEKAFEDISSSDWDLMMQINLRGPFLCVKECLPNMLKDGWGRIINISSIGGQWGGFNQVHYAASKAGLINLTRSLARLYSGRGITSNAIAIGLVKTEMTMAEISSPAGRKKIRAIPRGRLGTPSDVAEAVLYLSSDRADYVTGQTLNVNGGMLFA